mgnify:CR=1 FL=1
MKDIAVLLTVHNRKDKTLACLSQLFDQEIPEKYRFEVFLTDDGCIDGTPEAIKSHFPEVHIIQGDGNLYWNRGMYTAWEAASQTKDYDYFLWLNDDTFVYQNMLKCLLDISIQKNNRAIIVGPTQSSDHKSHTYGGRITQSELAPVDGMLHQIITFNGNIVLVPQHVYKILGNLDPYYHHSWGDLDYGYRARKLGVEMFQVGVYLGECNRHEELPRWCNPDVPLKDRIANLKKPTQYKPSEMFHFEKKHYDFFTACYHYLTIYLRCIFPQIWIKIGKAKI